MNSSIFPLLTLFLAHLHSRPTHFWRLRILIHAHTYPAPQHTHSRPTHFRRPSILIHTPQFRCPSILIHAPHFQRPSIPIHAPHFRCLSILIHAPRTSPQTGLLYTKVPECIFTFEDFLQNLYRIYNRTTYYQNDLHIIRSSISEWPAYHGELR